MELLSVPTRSEALRVSDCSKGKNRLRAVCVLELIN